MQDLCCESMIKYIKIIKVQLVEKRCAINNQTDGGYLTIYYSHRLFIACCVFVFVRAKEQHQKRLIFLADY